MIKNTFKIDYQLKRDEKGRQMLFVSSYQNNIKIEEHFAGYIDDILTENKKQKEVINKINVFLYNHDKNAGKLYYKYDNKYLLSEIKEDIRDILKEVD